MENTSDAVGTITSVTFKSAYFDYSVNGQNLSGHETKIGIISDYLEEGDKFVVEYSNEKHSNYKILFNSPIIDDQEYIKTKSVKHEVFGSGHFIKFWYKVNDNIYERVQYIGHKIKSDSAEYEVVYSVNRPSHGLICVDNSNCWIIESTLKDSTETK